MYVYILDMYVYIYIYYIDIITHLKTRSTQNIPK